MYSLTLVLCEQLPHTSPLTLLNIPSIKTGPENANKHSPARHLSKTVFFFSAYYLLRFLTTITTDAAPAARTAITAIAIQIPTEALSPV